MKSTHKAEVVPVVLETHPNADSLSIVKVFDGGYTVVVRTDDWKNETKAVFITPDTLVPNIGEFSFLFLKDGSSQQYDIGPDGYSTKNKIGEYCRITVKKFRGVYSHGLLVRAPEKSKFGEDIGPQLGIARYEPVLPCGTGGDTVSPPAGHQIPVYDVDSLNRYASAFVQDEPVWVTEKIHGSCAKFVYGNTKDGGQQMFCSSHRTWKKESDACLWWRALKAHPEITEFCKNHPGVVVYGEVYGQVQKGYQYGVPPNQVRVAVFDILEHRRWLDPQEARDMGHSLPWVPIVERGLPFNLGKLKEIAEGASLVHNANNIREGIVVKPMSERVDMKAGRVNLKLVSNAYLEGKSKRRQEKKNKKAEQRKKNLKFTKKD